MCETPEVNTYLLCLIALKCTVFLSRWADFGQCEALFHDDVSHYYTELSIRQDDGGFK